MMNDDGQSDSCVVPAKSANKVLPEGMAEQMEGRRLVKGNAAETPMPRALNRNRHDCDAQTHTVITVNT